jgi:hypothetical protein
VWGVPELQVYAAPRNKTDDLTKRMKEAMGSLDRDTVAKACSRFCPRIEAVVANDGVFIEYVILNIFPCYIFFTSIKSDHFQLCCVIFYETFQNSGNIAATL